MVKNRIIRAYCTLLAVPVAALILAVILPDQVHADDSSCIVCHTDIDLLAENLGDGGKEKSPLQTGSG